MKKVCDIWKSRAIVQILKERPADDIWVMDCPRCGVTSYYNQGSYFSCRGCGRTFDCLSEDEESNERDTVRFDNARTLADTLEDLEEYGP